MARQRPAGPDPAGHQHAAQERARSVPLLKADPSTAHIKIVMLTASGSDVDRTRAFEAPPTTTSSSHSARSRCWTRCTRCSARRRQPDRRHSARRPLDRWTRCFAARPRDWPTSGISPCWRASSYRPPDHGVLGRPGQRSAALALTAVTVPLSVGYLLLFGRSLSGDAGRDGGDRHRRLRYRRPGARLQTAAKHGGGGHRHRAAGRAVGRAAGAPAGRHRERRLEEGSGVRSLRACCTAVRIRARLVAADRLLAVARPNVQLGGCASCS